MFLLSLLEVFLALICFLLLCYFSKNSVSSSNWPIIGMLPKLILHAHNIHDSITIVLRKNQLTFLYKGLWFSNSDILVTADPINVHYVMSLNFANFPKGPEFRKIFDVFGDGIFNADNDSWKNQRKIALNFMSHISFHKFLEKTIHDKLENSLIPLLQHVADEGIVVDFQDMLQRYTFDTTCTFVTGYDPCCLSIDFPEVSFSKAFDDAKEAIFYRHVFPEFFWKMQRWIGSGMEKKLSEAWQNVDQNIFKYIALKKQELTTRDMKLDKQNKEIQEEDGVDLLTSYITRKLENSDELDCNNEKFLRDTILSFMAAGRDTVSLALTWFFWFLSRHPLVETKIREEISLVMSKLEQKNYQRVALDKLVYLHCALCESLRLYPPSPFQHKRPITPDVLPSGHKINPNMKIVIDMYAMGRMSSIWGKDCLEFKPERWITNKGTIKHEPSYKFFSFNAGPRTCIGKEVGFIQMKSVVAAIMAHGYHVEVEKAHPVIPSPSIFLSMKHGLKVRITRVLH